MNFDQWMSKKRGIKERNKKKNVFLINRKNFAREQKQWGKKKQRRNFKWKTEKI